MLSFVCDFTVLTDHKPLRSLFTKALADSKIQRWQVLLAEYGAKIEYRKRAHNIRADMLSRLRNESEPQIAVIDTEEWVDPLAICAMAEDEDNEDYHFIRGVLCSARPPRQNIIP